MSYMKFVVPHVVSQPPDCTRLRRLNDTLHFNVPPLSGPSATLSPPCGERAGRGEALPEPAPGPSTGGEPIADSPGRCSVPLLGGVRGGVHRANRHSHRISKLGTRKRYTPRPSSQP